MISPKMLKLGSNRSVIRELFEFGKQLAAKAGPENVFDFSIGNPSTPAPEEVRQAIIDITATGEGASAHGYTSAQGAPDARKAIADNLNERFGTSFGADELYLTCGAAASLCISMRALITEETDAIATFAPYFTEYKVFAESCGGRLMPINTDPKSGFIPNEDDLRKSLTPKTAALLINSPNNPCGVVYSEETIAMLARVLDEKSKEYGHTIYLISDEPYREITYGSVKAPFVTKYCKNAIVCYSYSKSLSLPGERIGYVLVPKEADSSKELYAAVCGAGRSLGYICAPVTFQKLITRCAGLTADISSYEKNRNLLLNGLTELGFECVRPDGAFYLFVKSPEEDAKAFSDKAKQHGVLIVPADDFGAPGYVRIAYCVAEKTIRNSMPAFKKIAEEYGL